MTDIRADLAEIKKDIAELKECVASLLQADEEYVRADMEFTDSFYARVRGIDVQLIPLLWEVWPELAEVHYQANHAEIERSKKGT